MGSFSPEKTPSQTALPVSHRSRACRPRAASPNNSRHKVTRRLTAKILRVALQHNCFRCAHVPCRAAGQFKFSDEKLAPLYDVLFARDDLDVLQTSLHDRSVYANVQKWVQRRAALVARMNEYLRDR